MLSPTLASSLLVVLGAAGVSAQQRQSLWGQCGGSGWSGPTSCVDGAHCFAQNQWYHQCIPGAGTSPTSSAAPEQPTTLSTSRTTAPGPTSTTPAPGGGGTACP